MGTNRNWMAGVCAAAVGLSALLGGCSMGTKSEVNSASGTPVVNAKTSPSSSPGSTTSQSNPPAGTPGSVEGEWKVVLDTVKADFAKTPAQLDEFKKNLSELRISMKAGKFSATIPDGNETGTYEVTGSKIVIHPDQRESIIPELTIVDANKIHEHELLPGNRNLEFDLVRN